VDPKTVTLPKKAAAAATMEAPKPTVDLKPEKAKYQAKIAISGQEIPLTIANEIKEENGAWTIIETAQTPQGEIKDTTILEKGTLVVKKRVVNQGSMTIEFEVKDGKAVGSFGGSRPFSADLGGALFADGAGLFDVVATLPLAEGYATSFRNFDLQKQKVDLKQLKVLERV
jgi:hypothetical protein